jgi:hypothetical protein
MTTTATERGMPARLSIMDTALRLRRSYDVVRRMVVLGQLEGGKDSSGRWYVVASSVDEALRNAGAETQAT